MSRHIIFLNGIWSTNRPYYYRTIGPYQLKHWIKQFGFNGQVIDYCHLLTIQEIVSCVEQFIGKETIAIGASTTFWDTTGKTKPFIPEVIHAALIILKDKYPSLKLIAGGAWSAFENVEFFDQVFSGDSEDTLVNWLQEMSGKKGMSIFNKKFDITKLTHRFDDSDAIMNGEILPIELGRGCIFKCKFCSHKNLGKPKYTYQRNFSLLLEEMKYNKEKWNVEKYLFLDDTVNEDIDKIKNLASIKTLLGFQPQWIGYCRADLIWSNKESADLLKESGLQSCFFGIETFHKTAAQAVGKAWSAKHGMDFIPELYNKWNKEINIHCNFIIGLPGEDTESIKRTLAWCNENPIGSHQFVPLFLFTNMESNLAQSIFTKSYKEYGYTLNDAKLGSWTNDNFTFASARDLALEMNKSLTNIKPSSWMLFSLANLGLDSNIIKNLNFKEAREISLPYVEQFKLNYLNGIRSIKQ